MRETSSDPLTVGMDSDTENSTALHAQHLTDNNATSMTTKKRRVPLELATEGQQTPWPQSTGLQVKKPRVQSDDSAAAFDPQASSSNSIMSSRQQHPIPWSFQTQSQQGFWAERQSAHGAAVMETGNTFSFPPPPSALEGSPHGRYELPMAYLPANHEVPTQLTPMTTTTEEPRLQISCQGGKLDVPFTALMFAPSQDVPPFTLPHPTSTYSGEEQGDDDDNIQKSLEEIRRQYWDQILILFGKQIPASMHKRVLDELSVVKYPWTSHRLYRGMTCEQRKKGHGNLKKLHEWMYGSGTTTHTTWRDTLCTKTGDDRKVPWVKREEIVALSVILAARHADYEGDHKKLQLQHERVEECKLTYLISNQDHVVADEYWKGFAEELEKDPDQTNLYEKVMQNKP